MIVFGSLLDNYITFDISCAYLTLELKKQIKKGKQRKMKRKTEIINMILYENTKIRS